MFKTVGAFALALALLVMPSSSYAIKASKIPLVTIGVPTDVLKDYHIFMNQRHPLNIESYSGPHSRRDVVEVVLIQQALILGGLTDTQFELKPFPTYLRLFTELREGAIVVNGTSIWLTDLEKDRNAIYISDPAIENGMFSAGLYTSLENNTALEARTLSQIQKLSAVSSRDWPPDWATLTSLNLRDLRHVQNWKAMVKMTFNQRVDFLLAPFQQNKDLLLHVDDMTLTPIHGVKLSLSGSRHFAVSKKNPAGKAIFTALQQGLKILKERGDITRAYRESGFFSPQVENWHKLN